MTFARKPAWSKVSRDLDQIYQRWYIVVLWTPQSSVDDVSAPG